MAKVLLIEDEVFVRELYEKILKQSGFEVILSANANEAFEKIQEKPDIILLDIILPGVDGIQILKKLKSNSEAKNIPVLMLTNNNEENIIQETIKLGAAGYMVKLKTTPYELVTHVKEFLPNSTPPAPVKKPAIR